MIISKKVKIKTLGTAIKYFKELGYPAKHKKTITVDVKDLSFGSDVIIKVKCDICNAKKTVKFSTYNKNLKNLNLYCCCKCKNFKHKITCLDRYGVENVSQLETIKNKKSDTCLKNYSVTNPSFSKKILTKIGDTLEKNYGVRYALQNKEILEKAQNTTEKRFGVRNALKNTSLFEKSKATCFLNHGVEFTMQSPLLKENAKQTRIKNGDQIPDELLSKWEIYKRNVTSITQKYKKQLFNDWDGYDYYDKEYIKDNFILFKCRSRNYPTIDHKVSTLYGFTNGIDANVIGDIENLCITKLKTNVSKGRLNFDEFIQLNSL